MSEHFSKHTGSQSMRFANPPAIIATASVVGPREGEGPIASYFDVVENDALFGKESWEKAESEMVRRTIGLAAQKAGLSLDDIQYILAGDLLNQGTGSTFGLRETNRPVFGLFGACSTFGEAVTLGAALVDGGFADKVIASASSHFCGAEKTFRFPLELGAQRAPTAAWTVTGDGACVISAGEPITADDASASGEKLSNGKAPSSTGEKSITEIFPRITRATTGRIVDMGVKDTNNMVSFNYGTYPYIKRLLHKIVLHVRVF